MQSQRDGIAHLCKPVGVCVRPTASLRGEDSSMAIFHLTVKCFSRSKGHSAVAAAAYRSGARLLDARTGELCDYSRRRGVVASSLHLPGGAPALDRQALWDAAEAAETRKNSTVARECEVALPAELPLPAQVQLANDMAAWLVQRYRVAVDTAVHEPTGDNDERNVHAHLLMTTRVLDSTGFGAKTRLLDSAATGSAEVTTWREHWAALCNAALEAHGHAARVDHRSHADRGLEDLPTIKVGKWRGSADRNEHNAQVRTLNHDLAEALAERAAAAAAAKVAEADQVARDQAARIAAAQAEYSAALEQRALVERRAAQVRAWRSEAEEHLRGWSRDSAALPTEAERRRARAQLETARRSADQAQRELEKAQRAARSSRWWNPISIYRALVAHREMPAIEHRAGALSHALALIEDVAGAQVTREQAQQRIEQLRQQLHDNQVPPVPAPPVLRQLDQQQEEVDLPPQDDESQESQVYDRPR